jgi:hypothetical protein
MKVTGKNRIGTAALTLGAMLVAAGPAAATVAKTEAAQANRALVIRSQAMDQRYDTAALNALEIRSQALDRRYGLGGQATTPSGDPAAAAQHALQIRSDALNRYYHLGTYAVVVRPANGFDWADAGVGGAATLGLVLVAGGLVLGARRHRHEHPGQPQTS